MQGGSYKESVLRDTWWCFMHKSVSFSKLHVYQEGWQLQKLHTKLFQITEISPHTQNLTLKAWRISTLHDVEFSWTGNQDQQMTKTKSHSRKREGPKYVIKGDNWSVIRAKLKTCIFWMLRWSWFQLPLSKLFRRSITVFQHLKIAMFWVDFIVHTYICFGQIYGITL